MGVFQMSEFSPYMGAAESEPYFDSSTQQQKKQICQYLYQIVNFARNVRQGETISKYVYIYIYKYRRDLPNAQHRDKNESVICIINIKKQNLIILLIIFYVSSYTNLGYAVQMRMLYTICCSWYVHIYDIYIYIPYTSSQKVKRTPTFKASNADFICFYSRTNTRYPIHFQQF